ncbi:MAG: hypothetical protein LH471_10435 [Salinibacterium sp.]|nr:hypothetical protein [Salinibacterium sp.]
MASTTHRALLASVGIALCLVLAGCSAPVPESTSGSDPAGEDSAAESTETSAPTENGEGAACSDELDAVVSPGQEATRVATSQYTAASIAGDVLDAGCIYEFTSQGKVAQWAWLPGAATTDATDALVADGFTVSDTFENSVRYESPAGGLYVTVITVEIGKVEGSDGIDPIFGLIGPYVAVFQDFQ